MKKMHRDSVHAALLQRICAVDERLRLHGAPRLVAVAHRIDVWRGGSCQSDERKREWLTASNRDHRLRLLDK